MERVIKVIEEGPVRVMKFKCKDCEELHYNVDITMGKPPLGASFGVSLDGELLRLLNVAIERILEE